VGGQFGNGILAGRLRPAGDGSSSCLAARHSGGVGSSVSQKSPQNAQRMVPGSWRSGVAQQVVIVAIDGAMT
jgi:hypothetical protein